MNYSKELDGLRATAVLLVLWAHFPKIEGFQLLNTVIETGARIGVGYFGVDLFFVLSGFLITSNLLKEKKQGTISIWKFYGKRLLRIAPIYYISLIFCWFYFGSTGYDIVSSAFYVSNYYFVFDESGGPLRHTWSLSVEEQFYLFWPFIVTLLSIANLKKLTIIYTPLLIFLLAIALVSWNEYIANRLIYRATPFRMLSLCLGAYLAIRIAQNQPIIRFKWLCLTISGITLLILALLFDTLQLTGIKSILTMYGFSLLSFAMVCGAYSGLFIQGRNVFWLFRSRPLVSIGKVSYGLYLYHAIILFALNICKYQVDSAPLSTWLIALTLSILLAYLSYYLLERNLLNLKDRLFS